MKKLITTLIAAAALLSFAGIAEAADADWKPLSTGVNREWNDISCPEPRVCYATAGLYRVGGAGAIVKTTDGGDTFTVQDLPSSNPLHSISCTTAAACYAAGDFGTVLKTTNGGATWTEILVGSKANRPSFTDIYAVDDTTVVVVGRDTFIYRSTDGGETWTPPTLRTFADYYGVHFSGSQKGYITGNDGAYLITEDGGETWKSQGGLFGAGTISVMRNAGSNSLFAVGETMQKSIDGGKTWTKLSTVSSDSPAESFRSIDFPTDQVGYAVTAANIIRKTVDAGATWTAHLTASGAGILRAIECPSSDYCIAVGGQGTAYRLGTPPSPPPPPPAPETAAATSTAVTTIATTTSGTTASATRSKAEIEAELQQLLTLAASLMATSKGQAAVVAAPAPAATTGTTLTRTLKKGAKGDDVKELQRLLAGVGGVYPEGAVNGTFGPATLKAVKVFQVKYDLAKPGDPGYGVAGPKTRAKLIE